MAENKKQEPRNVIDENGTMDIADINLLTGGDLARVKVEEGKTVRIHLLSKRPYVARVQYTKQLGVFRTLSTYKKLSNGASVMDTPGIDVELLGTDPRLTFVFPVVEFETDKNGGVPKSIDNIVYTLKYWTVTPQVGKELSATMGQLEANGEEVMDKDLMLFGVKTGVFNGKDVIKPTITPVKSACTIAPKLNDIIAAELEAWKYRDVSRYIARMLTEAEIIEGLKAPQPENRSDARKAMA